MRPWMIVFSSMVVAIVAAAAMGWPELSLTPRSAIVPSLMPLLPRLVVTALAVYALSAIVLATGNLIVLSLRLRRHLTRAAAHQGPARPDWTAAFAASGLQRLAPLPAFPQPRSARPDGMIVLQGRLRPREARREAARLCYLWAARTHFFSALVALAATVAMGVAQQHGPVPIVSGPIPTLPAGLVLVGLILLAILGRLAIDVTIDPLIEAISGLPTEPVEVALLRRAVELLEATPTPHPQRDLGDPAVIMQIPDRLIVALEQGHHALSVAIERLSATTDGLASTTRSAVEALEKSAFHLAEQHQSLPAVAAIADTAELFELRQAVVALTAVLDRTPVAPAASTATVPGTDLAARHAEVQPGLADQLKQLLQEIGTTP
jgi:hypothetical protein